jgi:hypothetical protein
VWGADDFVVGVAFGVVGVAEVGGADELGVGLVCAEDVGCDDELVVGVGVGVVGVGDVGCVDELAVEAVGADDVGWVDGVSDGVSVRVVDVVAAEDVGVLEDLGSCFRTWWR